MAASAFNHARRCSADLGEQGDGADVVVELESVTAAAVVVGAASDV